MELTQNPTYDESPGLLRSRSLFDWIFAALVTAGAYAKPQAILLLEDPKTRPKTRVWHIDRQATTILHDLEFRSQAQVVVACAQLASSIRTSFEEDQWPHPQS